MNVALKPEHQKFVEEQVKAGRYASAEDVIGHALSRLMAGGSGGEEEIDDDTLGALQRSDEQVRRGEGMTPDEVREHFRRRGVHLRPAGMAPAQDDLGA